MKQVAKVKGTRVKDLAEIGFDRVRASGRRTAMSTKFSTSAGHDLLQTVVDSVSDLIFVKDRDGRFILVNRALREACGDIEGKRLDAKRFREVAFNSTISDAEVLETGAPCAVEHVIEVGGSSRIFHSLKVPWVEDGELLGVIGVARDITERHEAEQQTLWAANHDPLTGLANRASFNASFESAIRMANLNKARIGLLHFDLDHFKEVNDSLGHDAGDKLLLNFAQRLRGAVRENDIVARLGGDEFAVILQDLRSEQALGPIVESILSRVRGPFAVGDRTLDCRTSVGASIYPQHGKTVTELLKNADIALYAAKSSSRGGLAVFDGQMRSAAQRRLSMLSVTRHAIDNDLIVPHYQPKVSFETGKITGFEALLRVQGSDGTWHPPSTIYTAFEDAELAVAVADRVLDKVMADIRDWLDRGIPFGHVAVNASPAEFRRDDTAERMLGAMARWNIPTPCVQLEVTESVFVGLGAEPVERALKILSREGVKIALDDFGTGFASLRHLQQFPVDILKIDQNFVHDIGIKHSAEAIIRLVQNLGLSLDIEVVAEGVETEAQASWLRQLGCHYGQGFLYSPAVPSALVPKLLGPKWNVRTGRTCK